MFSSLIIMRSRFQYMCSIVDMSGYFSNKTFYWHSLESRSVLWRWCFSVLASNRAYSRNNRDFDIWFRPQCDFICSNAKNTHWTCWIKIYRTQELHRSIGPTLYSFIIYIMKYMKRYPTLANFFTFSMFTNMVHKNLKLKTCEQLFAFKIDYFYLFSEIHVT